MTGHPCPGTPSRQRPVGSSWKSALLWRSLIAAQKVNGRVKIKRKTNQIDQTQKAFLVLFNLLDFGFDVEAAIKRR
ncbi:hypothetical protein LJN55_12325 [Erwinia rhapontici]|uniref:hypothetical protein n=1 Tax=Erwinia rhapontici TaxID=55212 RepID=UPI001D0DBED0|nr:hypothetical protein [Erwinia rhapontici]UDQ78281.1 hypothetical protein LJN55_12325 [Erwinia rhapontici]